MKPTLILAHVALITGIPAAVITGPRRSLRVVRARYIALAALHQAFPCWSLGDLARAVGRHDHSTAVHALQQYEILRNQRPSFRATADEILADLFLRQPITNNL